MIYLKLPLLESNYEYFIFAELNQNIKYCKSQSTANICKMKRVRDLKIILMEKAVNFT